MNVNLRAELGSDTAPAGVTNILGARPATAAMHGYDEPQHEDQVAMFITFETTHEAMQKVIIPPPLEVDTDAPPVATLMAFMSPKFRGRDGRITPYTGFCFFAPSQYKDTKGQSGWEFVDGAGPAHDKTVPDLLVYTGQVYGMLKKLGDIHFYKNDVELPGDLGPVEDGDEVFVSVDRRGERLAELRLRVGQEVPLSGTAASENRSGAQKVPVLGVREIPTVNYKGYVDRSIVTTETGPENSSSPKRMWTADPVSLDFWASELESLDLLPVKRLLSANIVVIDGYARSIETMSVLEQLPLDPDNVE